MILSRSSNPIIKIIDIDMNKNARNHRATNDGNEDTVKKASITVDSRSHHPSRAIPHHAMMPSFEAAAPPMRSDLSSLTWFLILIKIKTARIASRTSRSFLRFA
jgi:hypothetical protein